MDNKVVMITLLLIAGLIAAAESINSSQFRWWGSEKGCPHEEKETIVGCSECTVFPTEITGYWVDFGGATVSLYNERSCDGDADTVFTETYSNCCAVKWQALSIHCFNISR